MLKKFKANQNLAMELVRVTEAAAISASRFMGLGDKNGCDKAAVDAMRIVLNTIQIEGEIIIGEGEKDKAPMLYNGEKVGSGKGPLMDIAIDPVEGTRLLALGRPNSIAVIAATEEGGMWRPGPSFYMKKIVTEKSASEAINIKLSPAENIYRIAEALNRKVSDLTVFILEKERHKALIDEVRKTGARISLNTDGDVMGALMAATPGSGIDILMGTGGTPEGIIAAVAVKALQAGMQAMCDPQSNSEKKALNDAGISIGQFLGVNDLIQSDDAFFAATGITDGSFLEGVHFDRNVGVTTHSIVIRSISGSIRYIKGIHHLNPEHIFGKSMPESMLRIAHG